MRVLVLGSHSAALIHAISKVLVGTKITVATEEEVLAHEKLQQPLYGVQCLTHADLDVAIRQPREPFYGFQDFRASQQALNRKQQSFKARARR